MKKQKSLRQLARELGVSPSYLSQVKSGVRPASQRLLNMLSSVNHNNDNLWYNPDTMPSCVVVARGTLDPLALVRIQARQPFWTVPEPFTLVAIKPKDEMEVMPNSPISRPN